ncbi:hypothetical protein [Corynebacterium senegalense]|uniref:hypothetical protein n=1 Tax=Corynebacterium senegalense TaxID=2080750 RepID=UPI0015F25D22|nr:hypothetical protein [Corynebacterium senegalense]
MTDKRLTCILLVVGVALRTAVAARGWLYWDDLILQSKAREAGLAAALFQPHDGHLMPAAWVIEWALATFAPLNWPAALVVLVVLQLWAAGAVAWAARQLAGRWTPVPVVLYLVSPLTLPVTTWLAAGVNALPLHAALATVLGLAARARHGDLLRAAGWLALGLAFNERALLVAPLALAALACWGHRERVKPLATALAAPTIAWAAVYLALVRPDASSDTRVSLAGLIWRGYAEGLVPAAAGGPWVWGRWQPSPPFAQAPLPLILLGVLVIGAVLWWSRGQLAAWIPVAVYPLVPILALWLLRSGANTAEEIVLTLRHLSEEAVLVSLTLAVLLRTRTLPALAVGAVAASCLFSSVTFAQAWADQPAREYFAALREPGLNQDVPAEVLLPVATPHNRLDHLAPWLVTGYTEAPTLIDAHGNRHPATLVPARTSAEACRAGGTTTLPLDGPLYDVEWTVLLNYNAAADGTAEVALDGEAVEVPVRAGLHQVWVRVEGGGASISVRSDVEMCFGRSDVGQLAARD